MQPKSSNKVITRRDFLKTGGYAAAGGLLGLPLLDRTATQAAAKSRVVLIRDSDVVDSQGRVNETVLELMLDQAVTTLLGAPNPLSAWQQLFRPGDVPESMTDSPLTIPEFALAFGLGLCFTLVHSKCLLAYEGHDCDTLLHMQETGHFEYFFAPSEKIPIKSRLAGG